MWKTVNATEREIILIERETMCKNANSFALNNTLNVLQCPKVFDGLSCWNDTAAGETAFQPCPFFMQGVDPKRLATKECLADGTWFKHPESHQIWSNYTKCLVWENVVANTTKTLEVAHVYEIGYLISLGFLLIALGIYCHFRILDCTRVQIHKHLFVSFIMNNVLWLLTFKLFYPNQGQSYPTWCFVFPVLLEYFGLANFFWMFSEGFFIHSIIVFTFYRTQIETRLLKGFVIFGWIGPIIPMGFYLNYALSDPNRIERCFVRPTNWEWILSAPKLVVLFSNTVFLINILRTLFKLKESQRNLSAGLPIDSGLVEKLANVRKGVRATMILIPLLGTHFILADVWRITGGSLIYYEYTLAILTSLQGFFVALLFCICDGKVIPVLRRSLQKSWPNSSNRIPGLPQIEMT